MKNRSCNEVLEILSNIPIKDYKKIPREEISKLRLGIDEDYNFIYDTSKKFSEQSVSRDALMTFTRLYYLYIADDREKKGIKEILEMNNKGKEMSK